MTNFVRKMSGIESTGPPSTVSYRSKGASKTDLPAANAEEKAEHIALLLLLQLLEVFKGTHFDSAEVRGQPGLMQDSWGSAAIGNETALAGGDAIEILFSKGRRYIPKAIAESLWVG